jgi:hypothetical protein
VKGHEGLVFNEKNQVALKPVSVRFHLNNAQDRSVALAVCGLRLCCKVESLYGILADTRFHALGWPV